MIKIIFSFLFPVALAATSLPNETLYYQRPPDPEPQYEVVSAQVTAYTSDPEETWGDGTITASGKKVTLGMAACPRRYTFGTRIVVGGKNYVCEDRLAQKYDDRFDLFMDSKEEAYAWGIQTVDVRVIPNQ